MRMRNLYFRVIFLDPHTNAHAQLLTMASKHGSRSASLPKSNLKSLEKKPQRSAPSAKGVLSTSGQSQLPTSSSTISKADLISRDHRGNEAEVTVSS